MQEAQGDAQLGAPATRDSHGRGNFGKAESKERQSVELKEESRKSTSKAAEQSNMYFQSQLGVGSRNLVQETANIFDGVTRGVNSLAAGSNNDEIPRNQSEQQQKPDELERRNMFKSSSVTPNTAEQMLSSTQAQRQQKPSTVEESLTIDNAQRNTDLSAAG